MNTEITDTSVGKPISWVAYDAECSFCTALAGYLEAILRRNGFGLVPLQEPWLADRLGRTPGEIIDEMKLLTNDGRVFGGADAAVELGRSVWILRPVVWITAMPGGWHFLKWSYRWIARHRKCGNGFCRIPRPVTVRRKNTL